MDWGSEHEAAPGVMYDCMMVRVLWISVVDIIRRHWKKSRYDRSSGEGWTGGAGVHYLGRNLGLGFSGEWIIPLGTMTL